MQISYVDESDRSAPFEPGDILRAIKVSDNDTSLVHNRLYYCVGYKKNQYRLYDLVALMDIDDNMPSYYAWRFEKVVPEDK